MSTLSPILKFGRNADVDVGTEDIWSAGGVWVQPTAARVHAIVSTDAKDTSNGVGARTINVLGLSSAYAPISETVTLNGTTPVNTASSYIMIYRMYVITAGSELDNAGVISATAATDSTVTAEIRAGENQTLMAIYQIPAGYTGKITRYYANAGNVTTASTMTIRLLVKEFGEVYQTKHIIDVVTTGENMIDYKYSPPLTVGEKAIVKLNATAGAANMSANGGFDIELSQTLT